MSWDWNRLRITLSSFLAYFVMSGMLSQAGLITRTMSEHFQQPLTEVTALFSFYGTGVLIGSALAVALLDRARTGWVVMATSAGLAAALAMLWWTDSWLGLRWWLLLAGTLGGIGLAAAAFVITRAWDERLRASMLIATDLCFSAAGIVMSFAVTRLLLAGADWSAGYLIVAAAAGVNFLLAVTARFPDPPPVTGLAIRLPRVIWLCGAGLLCYTFAQTTLMVWLPNYLTDTFASGPERGGAVIGSYWTGMALGQIAVFFVVLLLSLRVLLGMLLLTSLVLCVLLPLQDSAASVTTLVFALGIANSGVLKLVISWASLQMPDPPPRLVSTLLLCATGGTALSPVVSARIVEFGGIDAALVTAAGSQCALLVLIGFCLVRTRQTESPLRAPA